MIIEDEIMKRISKSIAYALPFAFAAYIANAAEVNDIPQISVQGGYIKLDIIKNSIPPGEECAIEDHYGRMVYT
jgi:hypothetical protein